MLCTRAAEDSNTGPISNGSKIEKPHGLKEVFQTSQAPEGKERDDDEDNESVAAGGDDEDNESTLSSTNSQLLKGSGFSSLKLSCQGNAKLVATSTAIVVQLLANG